MRWQYAVNIYIGIYLVFGNFSAECCPIFTNYVFNRKVCIFLLWCWWKVALKEAKEGTWSMPNWNFPIYVLLITTYTRRVQRQSKEWTQKLQIGFFVLTRTSLMGIRLVWCHFHTFSILRHPNPQALMTLILLHSRVLSSFRFPPYPLCH